MKNILFTFFIFFRGRRAFFLHFTIFALGRQAFLFCFTIFRAVGRVFLFLFSVNPMLQRHSFSCFFSIGLISNAHRAERSTNFLIMKGASMGPCCRPRPYGGYSCLTCESFARQCQRICRAIARRLELDSSRLKSTGDQGKN